MKRIIYSITCFLFWAQLALAQTPIIFRPAPGLNDGTDEGGANSGKDVYLAEWDNIAHGAEAGFSVYPISNCNSTGLIALMKFDVSSLPATVDSVKLVFHHFNPMAYCLSNCIADFHFAAVTEAWNEITVTYSIPPAKNPTPFYTLLNHEWDDSLKIKEYNITQMYREWRNGTVTNHGFEIYSSTVGCNNACVYFGGYTSDDTTGGGVNRPYLKIYKPLGDVSYLSSKYDIKIFPNPAMNFITIENLSPGSIETVKLIAMDGKVSEFAYQNSTINLSEFNKGIYVVELYDTMNNLLKREKINVIR